MPTVRPREESVKCLECGETVKVRRENYRYRECGLPNVILHKVEVGRCPKCGDVEVSIPGIEQLHRGLALLVARKRVRLAPEEVRFLRKHLGWSGVDFAQHMGVASETVSRWETGKAEIGPVADRLLRLMVANRKPFQEYPLENLERIDSRSARPLKLEMAIADRVWQLAGA